MAKKVSLHMSLDYLQESPYADFSYFLGCHNASDTYVMLARKLGCTDQTSWRNEAVTKSRFVPFLDRMSQELESGDLFLFSFTGHGLSIKEKGECKDEADGMDEAICFYDEPLIDDVLYSLLKRFKKGVRLILIFDSCFSEGMIREAGCINVRALSSNELFLRARIMRSYLTFRKASELSNIDASISFIYSAAENENASMGKEGTYFAGCLKEILNSLTPTCTYFNLMEAISQNRCGYQNIGVLTLGSPQNWQQLLINRKP